VGKLDYLPPWEIENSPSKSTYNQKEEKRMKERRKIETWKVIERKKKKKRAQTVLFPSPKGHLISNWQCFKGHPTLI
jgi:hypothetical protein